MHRHLMLAVASALFLMAAGCAEPPDALSDADAPAASAAPAPAEQAKPATQPAPAAAAPAAQAKFTPPIRGAAELGVMPPVSKRVGKEIVTTIKVKNLSTTGSIAGLKLDEFWYDKAGTVVTGDTYRHRKPLMPGEVMEIVLKTPADPRMNTNTYNFSHANGNITAKSMKKF